MNIKGIDVELIATGSTGNAILIGNSILVDCGVPYKVLEPYMDRIGLILISHEHGDHLRKATVRRIARERPGIRWAVGSFLSYHLLRLGVIPSQIDILQDGYNLDYGAFSVEPFALHHDVPNFGFKIYFCNHVWSYALDECVIWYATDTENLDGIECHDADLYLIESNYTEANLKERREAAIAAGEYWYAPEKRHLSFEQAVEWLEENKGPASKWVFIHGHGGEEQSCES